MHNREPFPPFLEKLIGIGYRMAIGAVAGFVCALIILKVRVALWGDLFGPSPADIWRAAYSRGALLGALYYPLAWLTLLEKENQGNALVAACVGTVLIGIVGFRVAGPATSTIAASVGFWGACAAMYQRRRRDRNRADFGSYFR